jgi:single-stranded-DNA-specific exonuclease
VVGIVAARLKEAADRPAVVIGIEGGIGKGSARSVPGVDIGAAMQRLAAEGLILRGGGHRMAAGLTVAEAAIPAAMARLGTLLARQGAGAAGPRDLAITGLLMPGAATPELVEAIEAAGPFGAGAPAPRWAFADQTLASAARIGDGHLRLAFGSGAERLEAIGFGLAATPLGEAFLAGAAGRWHVAGRVEINSWGGRRRMQLRLDDAARA